MFMICMEDLGDFPRSRGC